jgi:hypothetical protein
LKIQCENCSVEHELDPPAWVVSSGRPFRFRCSSCGHSQMVSPAKANPEDAPPRARTEPAPPQLLPDAQAVQAPPSESGSAPPVYLKQDGKVYLVRDWATVQRWIMERRVEREDLVSEGGVRWEPIGNRPELGSFFAAVEQLEAQEQQPPAAPLPSATPTLAEFTPPPPVAAPPPPNPFASATSAPPSPFANPFPFGEPEEEPSSSGRFGRLDDDTEGVPMGLPPLPTEEDGAPDEEEYPTQPAVRRGRLSEPTLAPADELLTPPPASERDTRITVSPIPVLPDPAMLRADTIPPDVAPPQLPPTPAPAPRVEAPAPVRPAQPSALALATTVIHEEPPEEAHLGDDPFFGKPAAAHDTAAPDDWDVPPPPRGLPGWVLPLAAGFTLVVLVGAFAVIALSNMGKGQHTPEPPPTHDAEPDLTKVITPPEPEKAAEPPPADTDAAPAVVDGAPAEAPTDGSATPVTASVVDAGKPPPEKPPVTATDPSKPPPEKPVSAAKLIDRGWQAVDRGDLVSAGSSFQKALGAAPDNADANYGYGYVLLKQGQNDLAARHLCRARSIAGDDSDIGREANGMLQASGLTCS